MMKVYTTINYIDLSLEEFLKKYPYKIGDKVYNIVHNENQTITNLIWDFQENEVGYQTNNNEYVYVNYLQPHKEETMEERKYSELRMPLDDDDKLATEATIDGDKITPPENYLIGKITKMDNGMLVEFVKKQQYPKTYVECAKILDCFGAAHIDGYKGELLDKLQELLICRDAYWKIAGDWKPDWNDNSKFKYVITCKSCNIIMYSYCTLNCILAFPTAEMRDAFYGDFKELIEECKELL